MPNYYEILKVAPTAETVAIEAALDAQYEQWSNLVTHQDPRLRLQAQQALHVIEQMRTTLLDPSKRLVYDRAIGVGGAVGGLVDPDVVLQMPTALGATVTPHTPPAPMATQAPAQPTGPGLWACSRGHDNPADTRYCLRCGEELVRTCPECGQLKSLHSTGLCGNCGYKYEVAEERKALSERISALNGEIANLRLQTEKAEATEPQSCWAGLVGLGGGLAFMGGIWGFLTDPNQGRLPDALAQVALPLILIGIGMWVLVLIWRNAGVSAKKRSIANLQAEAKLKEQELVLFRQRHSELSLRRTGD